MALTEFVMSANHLAPSTGGFEPQRAFNYTFELEFKDWSEEEKKNITLSVESVDFPRYGTQVIPFRWMNEVRKVAGGATVQQMQVTIRDFVDINTYGLLDKWMNAVHSSVNGTIGMASRYKSRGHLNLFTPEGRDRSTGDGIVCDGVWPSEFSATKADYEQDTTLIKITLVLQVDKIIGLGVRDMSKVSTVTPYEPTG